MDDRTSRDLAEQCIKVLEFICSREASSGKICKNFSNLKKLACFSVFEAGGLQCALMFVRQHGHCVHKDTLYSAMSVITRLCSKIEPTSTSLSDCTENLSILLEQSDSSKWSKLLFFSRFRS